MKIVILSGGTGSISLQRGLYEHLEQRLDGVEVKLLINAYDNGLSTGAVRQVMNGNILGPADVRKIQATRLQLADPNSPWLRFLEIRFTEASCRAKNFCIQAISTLEDALVRSRGAAKAERSNCEASKEELLASCRPLREAVEEYFQSPIAKKIDYNCFSLANIIYAGFAKANGNSLRKATSIMAALMGIDDNVLLNDNRSLFLGAVTASGKRVVNEGDIISWGDMNDPFVDVFFTDVNGTNAQPELCEEAMQALLEAHLIILSSGTQWSSLIPTYASIGFYETIKSVRARLLMVMNRQPDNDSPGQSASELIKILVQKYFPVGRLNVILDSHAHKNMNKLDVEAACLCQSVNDFDMSAPEEKAEQTRIHYPRKLAIAIGRTYFRDHLDSDFYVFDYDDTLIGRSNVYLKSSKQNAAGICKLNRTRKVAICTGNSIKAVNLRSHFSETELNAAENHQLTLTIFADGGANKYRYATRPPSSHDTSRPELVECINPDVLIQVSGCHGIDKIILALRDAGIPLSKIENRGNAIISIKPIDQEYRPMVLSLVKLVIQGSGLVAKAAGQTTIDISSKKLSKMETIKHILEKEMPATITYVGDEFDGGNDTPIAQCDSPRVRCLKVFSPAETAFFITTLLNLDENTHV